MIGRRFYAMSERGQCCLSMSHVMQRQIGDYVVYGCHNVMRSLIRDYAIYGCSNFMQRLIRDYDVYGCRNVLWRLIGDYAVGTTLFMDVATLCGV